MRRLDGREFVAELNGTLLRDSAACRGAFMVIIRDITERQRQEDELTSKNRELERFTYTVSHDFRSPLITIKGFANALLADAAAGRTDRMEEDLKRIVPAADKMSELLNGLLELSRVGRIVNPPAAGCHGQVVAGGAGIAGRLHCPAPRHGDGAAGAAARPMAIAQRLQEVLAKSGGERPQVSRARARPGD